MEQYLTPKARRTPVWQIVVMLLEIPVAIASLQACVEEFSFYDFGISLTASVIILALFLSPAIAIGIRWIRQFRARQVARYLAKHPSAAVSFEELARRLHMPRARTVLPKLLAHHYLCGLVINTASGQVIPATEQCSTPALRETAEADPYTQQILQLRDLNDRIDDAAVSERIERIESVLQSIFQLIQQQPDRAGEIRKLMDYYLPTTFKLLKVYSAMEKQAVQSESIRASRRSIEDCLVKTEQALSAQLDGLFQQDALDIDTDIQVMRTMMTADGLLVPENMPQLKR